MILFMVLSKLYSLIRSRLMNLRLALEFDKGYKREMNALGSSFPSCCLGLDQPGLARPGEGGEKIEVVGSWPVAWERTREGTI